MQQFALSKQLLRQIFVWSALLVTLVTGAVFWASMVQTRDQQIVNMAQLAEQRVQVGRNFFIEAEQTTATFAQLFVSAYAARQSDPQLLQRYQQWTDETSPGVRRLQQRFHTGVTLDNVYWQALSAFIGPWSQPRDEELQARIMLALELLNQLGPAWQHRFANTHVTMPENVLLNYWPESAWGLLARADLDITAYAVVGSTLQANNPQRIPNWTGLYFDESAGHWVITYQRPVDYQGRHLITPSHDVYVDDVMNALVSDSTPAVEYYIFNQQSQLVAGPQRYQENNEYIGIIDVNKPGLEPLAALYQQIRDNPPQASGPQQFLQSSDGESLLVVTFVAGPDWYHVTRYPLAMIRTEAMTASLSIAGLGAALLLAVLLVVWLFVRHRISRPLQQLQHAAEAVSRGHYQTIASGDIRLPVAVNNEIGLLARTLRDMSQHISIEQETLEREVTKRTEQLQQANEKLAQMAHLDGLTGLFNRRALDRDIDALCTQQPSHAVALLLGDVDHFKGYNDNYGHEAGDIALQAIASCLVQSIEAGRVYRYGGEELAVLVPTHALEQARQLAEQARLAVADLNLQHQHSEFGCLTISFGVTLYSIGDEPTDLLRRADKALYQAKASGRNRVVSN